MSKEKFKILVVDDCSENVVLLTAILSRPEYEFLTSLYADDAFRTAVAESPDLVVLDIGLPGVDGFQLFQLMKDDPRTASIPVIFVTSYDDPDVVDRAMNMGAADFIGKPIEAEDVRARVERVLKPSA